MHVFLLNLMYWLWALWAPLHTAAADISCRHRVDLSGCARVYEETGEEIEMARLWRWLMRLADNSHSGGNHTVCFCIRGKQASHSERITANTFSCHLLICILNVCFGDCRAISRKCKNPPSVVTKETYLKFRAHSLWEQSSPPFSYLSTGIAAGLPSRDELCRWQACFAKPLFILQMNLAGCGSKDPQCIRLLLGNGCSLQGKGGEPSFSPVVWLLKWQAGQTSWATSTQSSVATPLRSCLGGFSARN